MDRETDRQTHTDTNMKPRTCQRKLAVLYPVLKTQVPVFSPTSIDMRVSERIGLLPINSALLRSAPTYDTYSESACI